MINSCCWAGPSEMLQVQFNFSSDRFWTTRKFNFPTPATALLFLLWSNALLGCMIAAFQFALFLHSSKGYTAPAENCFANQKPFKLCCISHSLLNLVPLSCATLPPLDALADKNRVPKSKLSIFRTSQLSSGLIFR